MKPWLKRTLIGVFGATVLFGGLAACSHHTHGSGWQGMSDEDAAKYKARKDAEAYLSKKIREGSTGVWGAVPMPPNGTVNDAEAKTLAKHILSIK